MAPVLTYPIYPLARMHTIRKKDIPSRGLRFWGFVDRIKRDSRFSESYRAEWRGTPFVFRDSDSEEEIVDRYLSNRGLTASDA